MAPLRHVLTVQYRYNKPSYCSSGGGPQQVQAPRTPVHLIGIIQKYENNDKSYGIILFI